MPILFILFEEETTMKKILTACAAIMMTAVLTACSDSGSKEETTKVPENSESVEAATDGESGSQDAEGSTQLTIKEGVLQVGAEIGYPPMEYLDKDGVTPIGFDVDVAKAIGEILGLEVEMVDTAWDGIFSSLDSNRYDCVMSAVSINEDRKENYNLTEAYIANRLVLVTKKNSPVKSPEDLTGLVVATQTETTADEYMKARQEEGLELKDYLVYDQILQCFDDMKLNRVDAVLVDSVVAAYYMGEDSELYSVVWESEEAEPMAVALKKGNDELTAKIEEAIDSLYESGKMAEIAKKHFGTDITEGIR